MKRLQSILGRSGRVAIMLAIGGSFLVQAAAVSAETPKEDFKNIGAAKCKMCHKKAATGDQYTKWKESAHSGAFETLGTPEAAKFAEEAGVEGNPQEAAECLQCHATAWEMSAEELAASKITMKEGVSCESCHGAGSAYWKKKTMQGVTDGTLDGATVGMVTPVKATCVTCHNDKSPTFKGFDFDKMVAKIAHLNPSQE